MNHDRKQGVHQATNELNKEAETHSLSSRPSAFHSTRWGQLVLDEAALCVTNTHAQSN
ncbi:hypothetical protein CROQUDRAFT_101810 [Cronartium quercuum f. sp. fusiforme G11]|uniref:Uncharacterized protein n=1 Tax=Cronartium quercuum f. sp. fusiforme G11 TaxID=708437 RepID=A0A9P6N7U2_9BASI|nr:hypothetical protein CROQUDRAFT_101810 [Cronartium quercuum f. sp. fusiforme G11]